MNIIVLGAGYVGLSNALLLSKNHNVKLIDIDEIKISLLTKRRSPISDERVENYLLNKNLNIAFSTSYGNEIKLADAVVIATPTNFDSKTKSFDTSSIEDSLKKLSKKNYNNLVIIRSTIPIGFTKKMQRKYREMDIAFFPEFLREGCALEDNLYPSRIVCGSKSNRAKKFLNVLKSCAKKKNIPSLITDSSEAEAIKLFSNTYLAMRISFFNELDSFAMSNDLEVKNIIEGVSLDPRIGNYYNNPSFGFGGYCLPKDIQQLKKNFVGIPQKLIGGVITSNKIRKKFIIDRVLQNKNKKIGIFRLSMKSNSDNLRESATIDILKGIKGKVKKIIIYEPMLSTKTFMGIRVEKNINQFKKECDLIIANRLEKSIEKGNNIIFSRDIFKIN